MIRAGHGTLNAEGVHAAMTFEQQPESDQQRDDMPERADENASSGEGESVRASLAGIAGRLPQYAKLTARLAADTRMSRQTRAPLSGMLGRGLPVIDMLPGLIPVVGRFNGLLGMFATITAALQQLQPEAAEEHLLAVGLTREQVEADIRETRRLAAKLAVNGASNATTLTEVGARKAGRLVGKGLKAFRAYQAQQARSSSPVSEQPRQDPEPASPPELPPETQG